MEDLLPDRADRILDLGCGDGRMIAALHERWPDAAAIGLDLSPGLVETARQRFGGAAEVRIEIHDLMQPLPDDLGQLDVVVSALAIHHLPDERKRELFTEVFDRLQPNGVFYHLDVVASPTVERLQQRGLLLEVARAFAGRGHEARTIVTSTLGRWQLA